MVILNKIYTKTGDSGETALGNGARVAKFSLRVEAYGTVDELNSQVGVSRLHSKGEMDEGLMSIQNDLFDLGADLCRPNFEKDKDEEYPPLRIIPSQVSRLENEIDRMNEKLEPPEELYPTWWFDAFCSFACLPNCSKACRKTEF